MYKLSFEKDPETEAPGLAIVTSQVDRLPSLESLGDMFDQMTTGLSVGRFATGSQNIGFGGVGRLERPRDDVLRMLFMVPGPEQEGQTLKAMELAATVSVMTSVLNRPYDGEHLEEFKPEIKIDGHVELENGSARLRADLATSLVERIDALSQQSRQDLEAYVRAGINSFAEHLSPGSGFYEYEPGVNIAGGRSIHMDSPLGSSSPGLDSPMEGAHLKPSGDTILLGHNVERPSVQIVLLGGLAAMASYMENHN